MMLGEAPAHLRAWTGWVVVDNGQTEILIKAFCSFLAFYAMQDILESVSFYETKHEAR